MSDKRPANQPIHLTWERLPAAQQQQLTRLLGRLLAQYLVGQQAATRPPQSQEGPNERASRHQ